MTIDSFWYKLIINIMIDLNVENQDYILYVRTWHFCSRPIKGILFQSKFYIHTNDPWSPHDPTPCRASVLFFHSYPSGAIASCQCLNISIRLQSQGLWTCYFFFLGWSSPDNLMALFLFFKFTNHTLSQRCFLTTIFTQTTIIILSNSYPRGFTDHSAWNVNSLGRTLVPFFKNLWHLYK